MVSPSEPPLDLLPVEIQCSIFRLLDPIGLISISQTNSRLRRLIQPTRKLHVERLLALECLPEYGGQPYQYDPLKDKFTPDWSSPLWESMRFACSGCLRLLPRSSFMGAWITRIGYRKPIRGSPAANPITSWEPSLRGKHRTSKTIEKHRRARKRYAIAFCNYWGPQGPLKDPEEELSGLQECGMQSFQDMTPTEFESLHDEDKGELLYDEGRAVELNYCGARRYLRWCNECLYQALRLPDDPPVNYGTLHVPVIRARVIHFPTALHRMFPGLLDALSPRHPPSFNSFAVRTNYRPCTEGRFWDMYTIRCSECGLWKEQREFRFDETSTNWKGAGLYLSDWSNRLINREYMDSLRCNVCVAELDGQDHLGRELSGWLWWHFEKELGRHQSRLLGFLGTEEIDVLKERLQHLSVPMTRPIRQGLRVWDRAGAESVTSRIRLLVDLTRRNQAQKGLSLKFDLERGLEWVRNVESSWLWLKDCMEEVEEKGNDFLVRWALERDGSSLT